MKLSSKKQKATKKKMPRLSEVFKFKKKSLDEANLDLSKFPKSGTPEYYQDSPKTAKPRPQDTKFSSSSDFEPKAEKEPEQKPEKGTYKTLVPIPLQTDDGRREWASQNKKKFGKITNFLLNRDHWERGDANSKDAVQWEGDDWVKPKSAEAKEMVRIIKLDKLKPTDVLKPQIWKKHFEHKFGPQEK